MKLNQDRDTIERFGVSSESSFTIKTTAKAFDILSSGLYSDPIQAVVRELSCNAYDAHVAAGKQSEPFTVHLPNKLEPFFSVIDYGTGLSDDDIRGELLPALVKDDNGEQTQLIDSMGVPQFTRSGGLYTTYFDSTKTQSNDFIGAMGLGSKSPFSYTNAFEVISTHNGVRRLYSIFLNEDGIPTVALMGENEVLDGNGFEVKFTVKPDDYHTFHSRAAKSLKWFPVKPVVVGAIGFEFDNTDSVLSGSFWQIEKRRNYYSEINCVAVQGNVEYRLDVDQLENVVPDEIYQLLSNTNVALFFNIGEIDVAASREEVRYSKFTIASIIKKVTTFRQEVISELEKRLQLLDKSLWESLIDIEKLSEDVLGHRYTVDAFLRGSAMEATLPHVKWFCDNGKVIPTDMSNYIYHDIAVYRKTSTYSTSLTRKPWVSNVVPHSDIVVVHNDFKTGGVMRTSEYIINNNTYRSVIMIKPLPLSRKKENIQSAADELVAIEKELGYPPSITLSDVAKDPTKKEKTETQYPYFVFPDVGPWNVRQADAIHKKYAAIGDTDVFADDHYYILIKGGSSLYKNDEDSMYQQYRLLKSHLNKLLTVMNETDPSRTLELGTNVFGVSPLSRKRLIKNGKWNNLFTEAKKSVRFIMNEYGFLERSESSPPLMGFRDKLKTSCELRDQVRSLPENSEFRRVMLPFIDKIDTYQQDRLSSAASIKSSQMLRSLDLFEDLNVDITPFFTDDIISFYPMINFVQNNCYNTELDSSRATLFLDYIRMIDSSRRTTK